MQKITEERIEHRVIKEFLSSNLIDNNLRGYWIEAMVAEALGPNCQCVSGAWHVWDLQFGKSQDEYPNRIRIQVKNTARLQTWTHFSRNPSACQWELRARRKPSYFNLYNPNVPCEDLGYLCDVFILAYHGIDEREKANHRDPYQWEFFVVPVTPSHKLYPLDHLIDNPARQTKWVVRPETLKAGIRRRPPVPGVRIDQLTEAYVREQLANPLYMTNGGHGVADAAAASEELAADPQTG